MVYLEVVGGLVLPVAGAEGLVGGSVGVARHLGVSPLLVGLTLVGFGTSSPELVASVTAALKDSPGIAVGNVIGSNICNVFLILGLSSLIAPLMIARKAFLRDGSVLLVVSFVMMVVAFHGFVPRLVGIAFVGALGLYMMYCYRTEQHGSGSMPHVHEAEASAAPAVGGSIAIGVGAAIIGLASLVGGAYLLVQGSIALARGFGVSETIIGLTVVAVGTSLPELATSVLAAWRGQSDVAFGNVVGSNIYNILGILGVTALIRPIEVPAEIASADIWVMMASTLILCVFTVTGWRLARWEGATMLALYATYVGYLAIVA